MTPAARSADNQDDILHVGAHDGRHKSGMKITCFCFKLYIFKLNCNALLQYFFRLQRLLTLRLWSQCVHNSRKLNCCPIHLRWMERTLPPTRLFRYLLSPLFTFKCPDWLQEEEDAELDALKSAKELEEEKKREKERQAKLVSRWIYYMYNLTKMSKILTFRMILPLSSAWLSSYSPLVPWSS